MDWWVKDHGQPVERKESERRAAICVACPKMSTESLDSWFTEPASALIRKKMEARTDLKLETSQDDRLGVCSVCYCPMKTAVHEPLDIKRKHMSAEELDQIWEQCWIRDRA